MTWPLSGLRTPTGIAVGVLLIALLVPAVHLLGDSTGTVGPSIPLLFLVPVLFTSVFSGRMAGAAVAVLAVSAWDWFFIVPRYTITISDPRDLLGLLVFLAVALLTGQLATAVRRQAEDALRRAAVAEALYDLSQTLLHSHDTRSALLSLTRRLVEAFPLQASAVLLPAGTGWETAAVSGQLPAALRVETNRDACATASWVMRERGRAGLERAHAHFMPLLAGDRAVGVLELVFRAGATLDGERERQISTFANGAALVVERARLAEEERQAVIARESDALKTALLSSVSHDLRTPLTGIKAAASSLLQDDIEWSSVDRRAFAADIDHEADRLTRLVSNLLDLSRIEAGVLQPDSQTESIDELVYRTVDRMATRLPGTPLRAWVEPSMPPAWLDPVQIEQVLVNLLENAARYTAPGTPVEIAAYTDPDDHESFRFAVSDHGPGIPPEYRERVFDKFYSIQSRTGRHHGTGMGLAIVRGLVESHAGTVWIEETAGGGATVVVRMPFARSVARAAAPVQSGTPAAG